MLQEPLVFDCLTDRHGDEHASGSAADIASSLVASLHDLGLKTALHRCVSGVTAGGTDIQVWPRRLRGSEMALEHLLRRVAELTDDGVQLTLCLKELGPGDSGIRVLEDFCRSIRSHLGADDRLLSQIGLSLHSHLIPLQAYVLISRNLLGDGPRYVILDSLQMRHHRERRVQEETDRNWSFLWRHRHGEVSLTPAYGTGVRAGCPLLGDEAAEAIQPPRGLQAPTGSAWLPIDIDLPRYADECGKLNWQDLRAALEASIDLGNQLLDVLSWPTATQRCDAWLNRRLGILVSGLGNLVRKRGCDPAELECLRWANETLVNVRQILWNRSHALARQAELLPSLARSDPSGGMCDYAHRQTFRRRWKAALEQTVVRNRNLLVMSPYSVLPAEAEVATGFTDLLPVLAHADAYAFTGQVRLGGWNVNDFRNFHTRAWAVMQHRSARSLVAAGA